MDVKKSIQRAVEDGKTELQTSTSFMIFNLGGFVDLRRILKANNQLEYQPNLTQFLGGGSGIDQQGDVFESEEYMEMLRKQRDIDHKSDKLVNSSMSIFRQYTKNQDTIEIKVKELRSKNKDYRERQRAAPDSFDQIPTDAELKKKQFTFPPQDRQNGVEVSVQKINPRSMIRDTLEIQPGVTLESTQRNGINSQAQNQEQAAQQGSTTPSSQPDKLKFDFHQINNKVQYKKRENVINKQIGNLPRDIQAISDLQDDNKEDKERLEQAASVDPYDRSKVDYICGDLLESFSIAYVFPKNNVQKATHNLFFYRDLAPISRFLMKYTNLMGYSDQRNKNSSQDDEFSNAELIQQDEILFDIKDLTYSNISDVVSGRINDEQLNKYDNSSSTIEDLPPKIQSKVQELIKQSIENHIKSMPVPQVQVQPPQESEQVKNKFENSEQQKAAQLSKEQIKNAMKQKQHTDQNLQVDQALIQNSTTPGALSLSRNINLNELTPEQRKTQQELLQLHGQTDSILNRIQGIKAKKDDIKYIKDPPEYLSAYKELKVELQQCLNGLLFMILKTDTNPNPSVTSKNSNIELQVSQLLQNLDKIQGTKTTDGHLKSALLFTFLEEYKWIKQEDVLHNLDFDSSFPNSQKDNLAASNNASSKNGTFAGFYLNGQAKTKPPSTSPMQQQNESAVSLAQKAKKVQSKSSNNLNSKENIRGNGNIQDNERSLSKTGNRPTKTNQNLNSNASTKVRPSNSPNSGLNNKSSIQPARWEPTQIDTTQSFNQTTPKKIGRQNSSTSQKPINHQISQNSLRSPINSRSQVSPSPLKQSSQQAIFKSKSIFPINSSSQGSSILAEKDKRYVLEGVNIPGIKRGQNSTINKSYVLETPVKDQGNTRSLSGLGQKSKKK